MNQKNQNALYTMAVTLVTIFSEAQVALAESGTTSTSASSQTAKALIGIIITITWWICNSRKRKPIGGWLLYYYMQLFIGTAFSILMTLISIGTLAENLNVANWGNETMQYFLFVVSFVPSNILLIAELVFGSMLLSKKFRNRKFYNFLRIIIAASFVFGLIGFIIDSSYWPENIAFDILEMIGSAFWFLYFTFSKRVKMVIVENKWNPDIMYPPKENTDKKRE
mgnify:CR=1 FL=1